MRSLSGRALSPLEFFRFILSDSDFLFWRPGFERGIIGLGTPTAAGAFREFFRPPRLLPLLLLLLPDLLSPDDLVCASAATSVLSSLVNDLFLTAAEAVFVLIGLGINEVVRESHGIGVLSSDSSLFMLVTSGFSSAQEKDSMGSKTSASSEVPSKRPKMG